jgi:RNA polymerase sigma-70 factor, ECF subfamily
MAELAHSKQRMPVRESSRQMPDDSSWVTAARDGDRRAFTRLYESYAPMVHGVLLARVPASEVDDLVQEVFMTAFRRLSSLRETGSVGAWLGAIARNLACDYHRHAVPEDQLADDTPEEPAQRADDGRAAEILDAIRSLPETYRETLILRLVEGMTGPEIAARTGLTHGSVRVNLHRGMEQLRAKLNLGPSNDSPDEEMP